MSALFTPPRDAEKVAHLGNKGRTKASHERRGLQPVENCEVLLEFVEEIDKKTGEILTYQVTEKGRKLVRTPSESRAKRYALKAVVNDLFKGSETAKCGRVNIPKQTTKILNAPAYNKSHFSGLRQCGSVWLCPVCAAKIAQRRKAELVAATTAAKAMGLQVSLMTATIPHGLGDDPVTMNKQLLKAWAYMMQSRAGKELKKFLGIEGTIRALETTYGVNGFHPHFHVLVFSQSTWTIQSIQHGFLPLWQDACVKAGLPRPSDERGLRVDGGEKAAEYVAKGLWGLEDEMTKGHMKTAKSDKGMTPWGFLDDVLETDSKQSKVLFKLYAKAFKGKRQLYWSNGLKAKLGIDEVTDEELVAIQDEDANELAELTVDEWRAVKHFGVYAGVLDTSERSPGELPVLLKSLVNSYYAIWRSRNPGRHFVKRKK